MTYTKIPKPSARAYVTQNPQGKEQYDQAGTAYDDANAFYDGVNTNQYTKVAKPTGTPYVNIPKPT